jgi:enediyne biosynthesis protein E3
LKSTRSRRSVATRLNSLFRISPHEALFAKRGFAPTSEQKQQHLEGIGRAFISGYNLALEASDLHGLAHAINSFGPQRTGFAFEGAAMGLALTDHLGWGARNRWREFLEGPGAFHKYMLYVGYGWALARLPWLRHRLASVLSRHRVIEKWLMVDGYGFHEGYFHPERSFDRQKRPARVRGDAARVFDQGLGRCLWFYCGADVERVANCVDRFHPSRRADLWSGLALAVTYAGGATQSEIIKLYKNAAGFEAHLAQGSAFAAQARMFGNLDVPHTGVATRIFCGGDAVEAAAATDEALSSIGADAGSYESYEQWRSAIRKLLADARVAKPAV